MFDLGTLKITPFWGNEFYPPATDELIAELEQLCGHPLLPLHKEILKKYNGGGPEANCFSVTAPGDTFPVDWPFSFFYPLCTDRNKSINIFNLMQQYQQFLGPDTLPFAENDNQECYYFKWIGSNVEIWLFQFQEHKPGSRFITSSFENLLENLYFNEDLDSR